jgi:hypothetical protein
MTLPGPMCAPDSKMMLSLIFPIAALCRIVLELPKLLFCRGRGLYPEAIFGRLFPTYRTLLQTAEIPAD